MSFREAPTPAIKGQRELMEWCCLPKEANGFEAWEPAPQGLLPLLGTMAIISMLGTKLYPTPIALVRSSDSSNFLIPRRVVLAAPSYRYYLSLFHALCLLLLWGFAVNRNHWISNTPSIYHVRGIPCILTFDSENVLIPPLESSQYEWRGKSIYIVLWKVWAFLVSGGKIRVHENYPWHSLLEPGLHFAMKINMKLLFVNLSVRV